MGISRLKGNFSIGFRALSRGSHLVFSLLLLLPYYSNPPDLGPISLTLHRIYLPQVRMEDVARPSNIQPNRVDRITSCT